MKKKNLFKVLLFIPLVGFIVMMIDNNKDGTASDEISLDKFGIACIIQVISGWIFGGWVGLVVLPFIMKL